MAIYEKVNGQWREVWSTHVKVDGIWRPTDLLPRVQGSWKTAHNHTLSPDDIKAFHIIYAKCDAVHDQFPNAYANNRMPVTASVSGRNPNAMDSTTKGMLIHYERFGYEEGKVVYEGKLIAELKNGVLVDVAYPMNYSSDSFDQRIIKPYPGIDEIWVTDRIRHLNINILFFRTYETFRYNMYGWNRVFNSIDFLPPNPEIKDRSVRKVELLGDAQVVLPLDKREKNAQPVCLIGICRMLQPVETMMGSYGVVEQTFKQVSVNGIPKPFSIRII